MAGFLDKLFGRKDEQKEKLARIMAEAESQDHEFSICRRTSVACLEVGRGYMDQLGRCGNGMTRALNANDHNAFWAEHSRALNNGQLINMQFDDLRAFMEGTMSSGGLSADVREDIARQLDEMGEQGIGKMCRENDDKLYLIMKNGRDKTARLLQNNGLGHMLNHT